MPTVPCLICTLDSCASKKQPIPLPPATLGRREVSPDEWPNGIDWLYAACPECKQVSAHLKIYPFDLPDFHSTHHLDKDWLRISFRCGHTDCNTPLQFHVLVDSRGTQTTESELRAKLQAGYWTGASPCGHPISITNDQKVVFEWPRGKMLGYRLTDPLWKKI